MPWELAERDSSHLVWAVRVTHQFGRGFTLLLVTVVAALVVIAGSLDQTAGIVVAVGAGLALIPLLFAGERFELTWPGRESRSVRPTGAQLSQAERRAGIVMTEWNGQTLWAINADGAVVAKVESVFGHGSAGFRSTMGHARGYEVHLLPGCLRDDSIWLACVLVREARRERHVDEIGEG